MTIPESFDDYVYQPEYIDSSVLDVYVEPGPYQDITKVNLTWAISNIDEDQMKIQMKFEHYEYISLEGLDTIVVKVKNNSILVSKKDGG